jgi:hypothetical protein
MGRWALRPKAPGRGPRGSPVLAGVGIDMNRKPGPGAWLAKR